MARPKVVLILLAMPIISSALSPAFGFARNIPEATPHRTLSQFPADLKATIHQYRKARMADTKNIRLDEQRLVAEQEYQAEVDLSRLYTTHFVIVYPTSIAPQFANRVGDRLEQVYHAVGRRFASFPDHAFTVVLYPNGQFHAETFSPPWARGLFDGKIRLLVEPHAALGDAVLIHEYVHAIVHHLSSGRVPAWLSEGLALYFDGGLKPWADEDVQHSKDYLPLTMLHADLVALPAHSAQNAYRQSYEATRMLLAQYGFIRIRHLLERTSQTPDFASAFEAVLGQRYIEFERRWIAEQERKGF
jgi:hypothetical protein